MGYYVYQATSKNGRFTRITNNYVTGTSYVDTYPYAQLNVYMVRAIKLEVSATGSFYNPSQVTKKENEKKRIHNKNTKKRKNQTAILTINTNHKNLILRRRRCANADFTI